MSFYLFTGQPNGKEILMKIYITIIKDVADRILSLVIDQMYGEREIEYEVNAIKKTIQK